jgi:hypothetical protein
MFKFKDWIYCVFLFTSPVQLKIPSVYGLIDLNGNAQVDLRANNVAIAVNYWY